MGEGNSFSLFTSGGGGPDPALEGEYLIQPWTGGGIPIQSWMGGYPISGGGTPCPGTPPGIASTCYGYAAGGVPLAFTQEDFLVSFSFYSVCWMRSRDPIWKKSHSTR